MKKDRKPLLYVLFRVFALSRFRDSLLLLTLSAASAFAHDSIPGAPQKEPIALVGGTVVTVAGETIDGGTVLFNEGRIVAVGKEVELPENTKQIDVSGKRVYPGLFDAHTNLGLLEIPAVRATVDEQEAGLINPNVESIKAVNPDSELIPVTRSNGVLLALTSPSGSLLAGRATVMQLDGWTWQDMALKTDAAMYLTWPLMTPSRGWTNPTAARRQIEQRDETLKTLKQAFADAAAYRTARHAPNSQQAFDARWEAMLPVINGEMPLCVFADELQSIQAAVAFCEQHKLKMVLHGGYDAEQCAELLKSREIPVIITGTYRLPLRVGDDYDAPYTLPARLHKAGIKFCLSGGGRHSTENSRNLPYHAANAVAYGLPREEAIKAVTLYPAQIWGLEERVGALAAGKDATLFVASGDILETESLVEQAWIQGRQVDLSDRHKLLWKKYEEKYKRQKAAAGM